MQSARVPPPVFSFHSGLPAQRRDRFSTHGSSFLLFLKFLDFVQAPLVPASLKFRLKPYLYNCRDLIRVGEDSPPQNQHVCVIVLAAHLGSKDIVTDCCADTSKLVGRNRHPNACTTAKDAA